MRVHTAKPAIMQSYHTPVLWKLQWTTTVPLLVFVWQCATYCRLAVDDTLPAQFMMWSFRMKRKGCLARQDFVYNCLSYSDMCTKLYFSMLTLQEKLRMDVRCIFRWVYVVITSLYSCFAGTTWTNASVLVWFAIIRIFAIAHYILAFLATIQTFRHLNWLQL